MYNQGIPTILKGIMWYVIPINFRGTIGKICVIIALLISSACTVIPLTFLDFPYNAGRFYLVVLLSDMTTDYQIHAATKYSSFQSGSVFYQHCLSM